MENKDRAKFFNDDKIIAIDPGKSGGIAVYSLTKNCIIETLKMPETMQDLFLFFKMYSRNSICFLERVGGRPGMGGMQMFNFGQNFGHIEMALMAKEISTVEVTPQKWQKYFQFGVKGNQTNTQWKNKLKSRAQQLFPKEKIILDTADAVLIMEYARVTILQSR